jgi:hypothetical protein
MGDEWDSFVEDPLGYFDNWSTVYGRLWKKGKNLADQVPQQEIINEARDRMKDLEYTTPFQRVFDAPEIPQPVKDFFWRIGQTASMGPSILLDTLGNVTLSTVTGKPLPIERTLLPAIEVLEPFTGPGTREFVAEQAAKYRNVDFSDLEKKLFGAMLPSTPEEAEKQLDTYADLQTVLGEIPTTGIGAAILGSLIPGGALKWIGLAGAGAVAQNLTTKRVVNKAGAELQETLEPVLEQQGEILDELLKVTTPEAGTQTPVGDKDSNLDIFGQSGLAADLMRRLSSQDEKILSLEDKLRLAAEAGKEVINPQPIYIESSDSDRIIQPWIVPRTYGSGGGFTPQVSNPMVEIIPADSAEKNKFSVSKRRKKKRKGGVNIVGTDD